MKTDTLIDVKEASAIMGIAYQTLQSGLRDHLFTFGTAVQGEGSFRYIIFRNAFEKCVSGEMSPCNANNTRT